VKKIHDLMLGRPLSYDMVTNCPWPGSSEPHTEIHT